MVVYEDRWRTHRLLLQAEFGGAQDGKRLSDDDGISCNMNYSDCIPCVSSPYIRATKATTPDRCTGTRVAKPFLVSAYMT